MALEAIIRDETQIPDVLREHYVERMAADGKTKQWELTGNGIKTQADIDRVMEGKRKEMDDHKATKELLRPWLAFGVKPDEIQAKLDKFDELETAVATAGTLNEEKIGQIVESRIKTRLAPVEREKGELQIRLEAAIQQITGFEAREKQRTIHDAVRQAATTAKILPTALDDALMLAERVFDVDEDGRVTVKDQVGFTPGIEPDVWLTEMQPKRPHWWPESVGGGARGGKNGNQMGENPWKAGPSFNMTKQGQYIREHGIEKAMQMAALAGTTIGAPPAKTA